MVNGKMLKTDGKNFDLQSQWCMKSVMYMRVHDPLIPQQPKKNKLKLQAENTMTCNLDRISECALTVDHTFEQFDRWPLTNDGRRCDHRVYVSLSPLPYFPQYIWPCA